MIQAHLLARSNGLMTFSAQYHRYVLAEANTHRSLSRSTASNRAMKAAEVAKLVQTEPAVPVFFGKEQQGMAAAAEVDDPQAALQWWLTCVAVNVKLHEAGIDLGIHKQTVNRVLEPYQFARTVFTMGDAAFNDFLVLRLAPNAQPEMQALALAMREAKDVDVKPRDDGYHVPFDTDNEQEAHDALKAADLSPYATAFQRSNVCLTWLDLVTLLRSAGRCARVSYGGPGQKGLLADVKLALQCWESSHMSPFEHQAVPWQGGAQDWTRSNLPESWLQFRKIIETGNLETVREKLGEKMFGVKKKEAE